MTTKFRIGNPCKGMVIEYKNDTLIDDIVYFFRTVKSKIFKYFI